MVGTHDHALYLKAQVDNLTGHNEELRKELREVRFEATKARVAEDKAKSKVCVYVTFKLICHRRTRDACMMTLCDHFSFSARISRRK